MIRRFTIASIVVFALLIVAARAIGSTNKPPALAILDPGDCLQPCWHGIRPGVTTFHDAKANLRADPDVRVVGEEEKELCWQMISKSGWAGCIESDGGPDQRTARVANIVVWLPQNTMRLGDMVSNFGDPKAVWVCLQIISITSTLPTPHSSVAPRFQNGISGIAYTTRNSRLGKNIVLADPNMNIFYLYYGPADRPISRGSMSWRGFTQFVSEDKSCGALVLR
jgi:hypothetical protein